MTKALTGNHVPLSTSSIKPVSTSLTLSVPAHTPIIYVVPTQMLSSDAHYITTRKRTTGIQFCGHVLQMLSSSQVRQTQSFYSTPEAQVSLFIQNTMTSEKMICNKGNKPRSHSKKLRHLPKSCHTYVTANYICL